MRIIYKIPKIYAAAAFRPSEHAAPLRHDILSVAVGTVGPDITSFRHSPTNWYLLRHTYRQQPSSALVIVAVGVPLASVPVHSVGDTGARAGAALRLGEGPEAFHPAETALPPEGHVGGPRELSLSGSLPPPPLPLVHAPVGPKALRPSVGKVLLLRVHDQGLIDDAKRFASRSPGGSYTASARSNLWVICLVDFEESEEIRMLSCSHLNRTVCIRRWWEVAGRCPACMFPGLALVVSCFANV
ncbi:hypothetical protein MUK42_09610 [Musa troglodytarum]|uniref:RING-type domain-containing protein n=1 Tax=Musa troglodytarum TaxID=320322 RepID=A0A9E7E9N3_9LILI|nr:hypothetical protein MUK42_09610 [Musa troglodytarum]